VPSVFSIRAARVDELPLLIEIERRAGAAFRSLGMERAFGFLKKFYGWYLGRGRFPRPFKQELVMLPSLDEVEERLFAAAPGAIELVERLEAEIPPGDAVTLELPISIYGGG
jgi:hypothetical protein